MAWIVTEHAITTFGNRLFGSACRGFGLLAMLRICTVDPVAILLFFGLLCGYRVV